MPLSKLEEKQQQLIFNSIADRSDTVQVEFRH